MTAADLQVECMTVDSNKLTVTVTFRWRSRQAVRHFTPFYPDYLAPAFPSALLTQTDMSVGPVLHSTFCPTPESPIPLSLKTALTLPPRPTPEKNLLAVFLSRGVVSQQRTGLSRQGDSGATPTDSGHERLWGPFSFLLPCVF